MLIPRLLIVADDPLARAGLAMLLANNEHCLVVAQLNGDAATEDRQESDAESADLGIWDLGWDFDGRLPEWREMDLPIIALALKDTETAVLWASGASAVLSRKATAEQIIAAAQAVMVGLTVFDPKANPFQWINSESKNDLLTETLTPREVEVVQRLARGLTNKAIAQELDISPHTIKFHVNAIMNKLYAQNRTDAVVKATRLGFISL